MIAEYYAKMSQREKILLFATCTAIFFLAMDRIVLGPILSQMKVMDGQIEMRTETITRNLRIIAFQQSIFQEHNKYQKFLSAGNRSEDEIIGDHLRELENLANLQAVKIQDIQSGEMEANPVMREYRIKIQGVGSLSNVLGFMRLLEESTYLFKIYGFQLSPKGKDGSEMRYEMDLSRILINTVVTEDNLPPETESKSDNVERITVAEETVLSNESVYVQEVQYTLTPTKDKAIIDTSVELDAVDEAS
jgi:hypothetical protein